MNVVFRLKSPPVLKLRYIPGLKGDQGDPGTAATIAVGSVTTGAAGSSAAVTNAGTSLAAIFNFAIPRGDTGEKGWSPILAVVADGVRRVLQITDWTGGAGTKPTSGQYIGLTGLVALIGDAIDIRGDQGPSGSVTDGDKGDITVSSAGAVWTIDNDAITAAKIGDVELKSIAGLTSAADRLPYYTGSGTAALATFTSAGRALVDDVDAAAQRTTLGLAIGSNVQAYDADLAAFAGLTSAANKLPYFTGSGTMGLADLTAFIRTLLDDGDAGTARATLGAQAALGFTPIQQGGGAGQGTNKVYIGWAGGATGLKVQVDATDQGEIWTGSSVNSFIHPFLRAAGQDAALAVIGAAAKPTTSGRGTFAAIATATGGAAILPAGGTYGYCIFAYVQSSGIIANPAVASVAAGGTTIGNAIAGWIWTGFYWNLT